MFESLFQEFNDAYPQKPFLTIEEIAKLLNCNESVIYNWSKRPDPKKRPPRLVVGKSVRFPKRDFTRWLAGELLQEE